MIQINNEYQLLVYDGMVIDMMMNIVTIDDNWYLSNGKY